MQDITLQHRMQQLQVHEQHKTPCKACGICGRRMLGCTFSRTPLHLLRQALPLPAVLPPWAYQGPTRTS